MRITGKQIDTALELLSDERAIEGQDLLADVKKAVLQSKDFAGVLVDHIGEPPAVMFLFGVAVGSIAAAQPVEKVEAALAG